MDKSNLSSKRGNNETPSINEYWYDKRFNNACILMEIVSQASDLASGKTS